jgi:DsbC/DsbD-like thiol-disulfide interchange protein
MSYGVCREICIPVDATLSLEVPAEPQAITPAKSVAAFLSRVPTPAADARATTPALLALTAVVSGPSPMLRFQTKGAVDVFVEAPDGLFVPMARQVGAVEAVRTFEIDLRQAPDLSELRGRQLRVTLAREDGGIETTVTLPKQ